MPYIQGKKQGSITIRKIIPTGPLQNRDLIEIKTKRSRSVEKIDNFQGKTYITTVMTKG